MIPPRDTIGTLIGLAILFEIAVVVWFLAEWSTR